TAPPTRRCAASCWRLTTNSKARRSAICSPRPRATCGPRSSPSCRRDVADRLAEHTAIAERQIGDFMRDAFDTDTAPRTAPDAGCAVVGELTAASMPAAVRPSAPAGLRLAALRLPGRLRAG